MAGGIRHSYGLGLDLHPNPARPLRQTFLNLSSPPGLPLTPRASTSETQAVPVSVAK